MSFEIVDRYTRAALYVSPSATTAVAAVVEAVKSRANLYRADLSGADLSGANLYRANGLLPNGLKPLQISGTRHWIIVLKPGFVKIGCHMQPLTWWEQNPDALSLAANEGYGDKEIAEYRAHVAHARAWMEAHGVVEVVESQPAEAKA